MEEKFSNIRYYDTGQIRSESEYIRTKVLNGYAVRLHGDVKTYYPDGNIQIKKHYVMNKLNGTYTEYNPDQKIIFQHNYTNNKLTGLYTTYYINSRKKPTIYYILT